MVFLHSHMIGIPLMGIERPAELIQQMHADALITTDTGQKILSCWFGVVLAAASGCFFSRCFLGIVKLAVDSIRKMFQHC